MKTQIATSFAAVCLLGSIRAAEWRAVDPADLALKTPRVDSQADAEAMFWDIKIEDRLSGGDFSLAMNHYIRIKIFTDRGKEKFATVEIPRFGKRNISEVAARTIKPDGSVFELKKDLVFDRELVKTKGYKLRGKSFALPNVEAGDIIEYRYRETRDNETASHLRLYFQRDIPMWNVTYHLKPLQLPWIPFSMRYSSFQCEPRFQKDTSAANQGFYSATLSDVPAFKEEPNMPPEDQLRQWVLVYYEEDKKIDAAHFWKDLGKTDFAYFKPLIKADDLVKRTAAELISGTDDPVERVAKLDSFCRTRIRNLNSASSEMTGAERKAIKENHSPSNTLKQRAGTARDINLLFAALADAAGYDARVVRIPDRGDTFFTSKASDDLFHGEHQHCCQREWRLAGPRPGHPIS